MWKSKCLATVIVAVLLIAFGLWVLVHQTHRTAEIQANMDRRAQESVARDYEELAFESQRRADEIEIQTLELQDRTAELEGRPAKNRLAIARLQGKIEYDDLYKSQEEELIRLLSLYDGGDPEIKRVMEEPTRALLAAIADERRANAADDQAAKDSADKVVHVARQRLQAIAEKYKEALDQSQTAAQPR